MKQIEEWRDVVGYESKYQVSNLGRVKSLNYNRTGKEKLLKLYKDKKHGYLHVMLYLNLKPKYMSVHRLVCEAFLPNPENKPTVNHINGVKFDACLENLEWATYSENELHSYNVLGKKNTYLGKFGKDHNMSKPVLMCDKKTGEVIKEFEGTMDAGRKIQTSSSHISECCNGNRKSAGGYKWKYKN